MSRAAAFSYSPLLPTGADQTEYRLVTDEGVDVVDGPGGRRSPLHGSG
jgi:fumarate hydratase class I